MTRNKRFSLVLVIAIALIIGMLSTATQQQNRNDDNANNLPGAISSQAGETLQKLAIKGRAPKTGYTRKQFSDGWDMGGTCNVRDKILARDMTNIAYVANTCEVASGTLNDPYTGKTILFVRGATTSSAVQIDHVVALSDSWQKGAQQLTYAQRHALANDPLELLAVDGPTNQNKSDGDAATWLPSNKSFRCSYVSRQIAVKTKYSLWVTRSEYDAMNSVLMTCPQQTIPTS